MKQELWRCSFCELLHKGQPSGKHQPIKGGIIMVTVIVKEWEITVSITRTIRYPIEDNEDKEEMIKWANSVEGKRYIQTDFVKRLNCYSYPCTADMSIDDIELKEYEVKSTDTDPRV